MPFSRKLLVTPEPRLFQCKDAQSKKVCFESEDLFLFSVSVSKKIEYAPDWAPLLPEPGGDDDGVVGQVDVHPVDGWSTWHP